MPVLSRASRSAGRTGAASGLDLIDPVVSSEHFNWNTYEHAVYFRKNRTDITDNTQTMTTHHGVTIERVPAVRSEGRPAQGV